MPPGVSVEYIRVLLEVADVMTSHTRCSAIARWFDLPLLWPELWIVPLKELIPCQFRVLGVKPIASRYSCHLGF